MILRDNELIYHGSYIKVESPNLEKCRERKDFGRGFYLTTSKAQAERFTKASVKKARKDGVLETEQNAGYVSVFRYHVSDKLRIYEFADADETWLHCVVGHRMGDALSGEAEKWKDYDILCGKIANDNTNLVITAYMDGLYGELLSETADKIAIGFLEPDNLRNQMCFRTEDALRQITYEDCYEVRL